MTLNEMIEALKDLRNEYGGELECIDEEGTPLAYPEYNNDTGLASIVMCEKR